MVGFLGFFVGSKFSPCLAHVVQDAARGGDFGAPPPDPV